MNKILNSIIRSAAQIFSTQDSRFFLLTASKFTLIPILSFSVVFYSLWSVMEMNFNFFVANGFTEDSAIFYDSIFMNISQYIYYFPTMLLSIFLLGLFASQMAISSFESIENYSINTFHNDDSEIKVKQLNRGKLIFQVSRIFFPYVQLFKKSGKKPKIQLPKQLANLSSPPIDKVFLIQYISTVVLITLSSSILIYSFTSDLHKEIINTGLSFLPANKVVENFLDSQDRILFNVYLVSITLNIFLYLFIAKKIFYTVDGVVYGFARDMIKVIKGQHHVRLNPRINDPGQSTASIINSLLDEVFPQNSVEKTLHEAIDDTVSEITREYHLKFNKIEELNNPDYSGEYRDLSTLDEADSEVISMLLRGETIHEVEQENATLFDSSEPKSLYRVITPGGVEIQGVNLEELMRVVKELDVIEEKKKA